MSSSASARIGASDKFRASLDAASTTGAGRFASSQSQLGHGTSGPSSANWRAVSPGRASTGGGGGGLRPNSELLGASQGSQGFQSAETIDRWFEDLQHYEATLEEMAAASLDANFKEELGAIEQWFRVLSEAERTAALYSLLQSATHMQIRFFITVLQQMARQDPMQAALLSPANPSQLSMEAQMEAKLASLGLKSPASPAVRQFARQSLGMSTTNEFLSPNPNSASTAGGAKDGALPSPSPAQSTLANQRAKLKASARTSAPANLLLGASNGGSALGEGLKSPLWSKEETLRERSPSPGRPKSTGSTSDAHPTGTQSAQPASSASFLRSPVPADSAFADQLSPLVGGSWASMVNTPLVPMFGKNGETLEPGNFGDSVTSPDLAGVSQRLGGWGSLPQQHQQQGMTSPDPNSGIVLDDVRKFRRSARVSGGALSGMYDDTAAGAQGASNDARAHSAAMAQKRVQDSILQLKNLAANGGAGAGGAPPVSPGGAGVQGSRVNASGALSSPGLQQTAMAAQQNWRNANAAHLPPTSPNAGLASPYAAGGGFSGLAGSDAFAHGGGLGVSGLSSPPLSGGLHQHAHGQQHGQHGQAAVQQQAQAQLASLLALQQQMMQQQQQLQSLASGVGLGGLGVTGLGGMGVPGMGGNAGLGMGLMGQLSPRMGQGQNGGFGLGFGGMPSPRRSPRPHDRSPHLGSRGGASSAANPQQTPGSGQNPDEPLDMALLGDTPAWLRSLRLHKYTANFDGVGWKEMVAMGDKDLEDKGVGALGARRKLLKVFEVVRDKTGMSPTTEAAPSSPVDANGSPNGDGDEAHSPTTSSSGHGEGVKEDA
ncbi:hypothetical protein JCM10207_008931 [Rhodosporidiobolus poonsookiae]